MPGGRDGGGDLRAHDGEHGGGMGEDGGLGVLRLGELGFGAVEHERRERHPQGVVDLVKRLPRCGKPFRQILSHPYLLRPLPRTEPDGIHHRRTMLAQVKPAPKATNITVIPGVMRPVLTASSNAMAIEAADVLPKRSTLT